MTLRDTLDMKQWFPTPENQDPLAGSHRSWSGKLGVYALLGAMLLMLGMVSMLVWTTPLTRNELGLLGGLRVAVGDQTTVYVGDRHVGFGTVDVSWNQLLGAAGQPPLAIDVDPATSGIDWPDLLGAPEADLVWQAAGPTGTYRGDEDANFAFRQIVLKRRDGQLDHVQLVECEFPKANGKWQRLVIPIRARQADKPASEYFPQPGALGGGNVSRGMIPSRRDHATFELKVTLDPGAVPSDLKDVPLSEPLWAPAGP